MTMKWLLIIYLFYTLFQVILLESLCKRIVYKRQPNISFRCTQLTTLQQPLEKAWTNTTIITIFDSNILNIPGHSFTRFGETLVTLDLHESGIETCDAQAFVGLSKLKKLILWGNKLATVSEVWFGDMQHSLQSLDLSFNFIRWIDNAIFLMLDNLENFYFDYNQMRYIDYNMFAFLGNLKKVRFSKNPWNWSYRARLTWQLEDQKVEISDVWEDWNWMNTVIKDCVDSTGVMSDIVLDCAVEKLLAFTYETFSTQERINPVGCSEQTKRLIHCMRPPSNATGDTDYETIRRILEDYSMILPSMQRALSPFSLK